MWDLFRLIFGLIIDLFRSRASLDNHRKLVPTFYEKLIRANGDGAGLRVSSTDIGKIGMLICGENTNPLARYSLIAQGEQVHISSYPPVWPTRPANEPGHMTLLPRSASAPVRILSKARFSMSFPPDSSIRPRARPYVDRSRWSRDPCKQPAGYIDGAWPVWRDHQRHAVGDRRPPLPGSRHRQCIEPKQFHDVVGYYNRFDVFDLKVNRKRLTPIAFVEGPVEGNDDSTADFYVSLPEYPQGPRSAAQLAQAGAIT